MMNFDWMTLSYWEGIDKQEVWATLFAGGLTAISAVLAVAIAAYLTYRYTCRHSALTHNTAVRIERLRHEITAMESVWELLRYMCDTENAKSVLVYREFGKGDARQRTYYANFNNLKHFVLERFGEVLYDKHAGLHLPSDIKNTLYEYNGSLLGLYFRYEDSKSVKKDELIEIKNPQLVEKLEALHKKLRVKLVDQLKDGYGSLHD